MEPKILRAMVCALALVLLPAALAGIARGEGAATLSSSDVRLFRTATVVPGGWSQLVRNDGGIAMTFHTSGLVAGDAVTVWWVVFNNPRVCTHGEGSYRCGLLDLSIMGGDPAVESSILYATGHVIGGDGVGNFGAYLTIYDISGGLFGPGLTNPRGGDVHLVLRDHGPAIPSLVADQISSFNGGCPPNTCRNVQMSIQEAG